jgi:hypothetical protein
MVSDVDGGWDGQDGAEVFDEDNQNLENGGDMRTLEELPDVLDVTHAAGDDNDEDALIGEELDDDEIIALEADSAEADDEDDDLSGRMAEGSEVDDDIDEVRFDGETRYDVQGDNDYVRNDAASERAMRRANNDVDLEFTGDLNDVSNSDEEGAAAMESDTVSDEDLDRLGYSNAHTSGQP